MVDEQPGSESLLPRRELLRHGAFTAAALTGASMLLPRGAYAAGPEIRITVAPRSGGGPNSQGEIRGAVIGARSDLSQLRVVVYALGDKWYVQPTVEAPLTPLDARGRWQASIHLGKRYAALLVRLGYRPPATTEALPEVGGEVLAATVVEAAGGRTLRFSGLEWSVKASGSPVGPGPNHFSDDPRSAWVDRAGRLHLRLELREGRWQCAEVVSKRSFGYGRYRFYLDSPAGALDPNAVLGLFTWNDDPAYTHREIDIEFSRWGDSKNQNSQYVIQPYTVPANISRFDIPTDLDRSGHEFLWRKEEVIFRSWRGGGAEPTPATLLREVTLRHDVPVPGGENVRLNLWLLHGNAPMDGKPAEMVFKKFEFRAER